MSKPGDVVETGGVGKGDAERFGDIETVRPVLGEPGRGQRRRFERRFRPLQPPVGIGGAQGSDGGAAGETPTFEDHQRVRPFSSNLTLDGVIDRLALDAPIASVCDVDAS